MQDKIHHLIKEIEIFTAGNLEEVEQFRLKYLSKKGILAELFADFKNIPPEQKKATGVLLNDLKNKIQEKLESIKSSFETDHESVDSDLDLTRPAEHIETGARHPLSIVRNQIVGIFSRIGFTVAEDREIEDDWHNFSALNFPEEHPARDMQDTIFIEKNPDILLRTHTSPAQIRVMEKNETAHP